MAHEDITERERCTKICELFRALCQRLGDSSGEAVANEILLMIVHGVEPDTTIFDEVMSTVPE